MSDTGIDSNMSWNGRQTSAQYRIPGHAGSSSETNIQYLHHAGPDGLISEWNLGEPSAAQSQHDDNGSKGENALSINSQVVLVMEEQQHELYPLDNVDADANGIHNANGSPPQQISGHDTFPQNLNLHSEFGDHKNDGSMVYERSSTYVSIGSANQKVLSAGSSSDTFEMPSECNGYMEEGEDTTGCSSDGHRISCKRKTLHVGQSSGAGSSNCFPHSERSQWHTAPAAQIASSRVGALPQTEKEVAIKNGSDLVNPRLRLGGGGSASATPFLLASRGAAESSHGNFRLHLPQQGHIPSNSFSTEADVGDANASLYQNESRLLQNRLFDLNPDPSVENGSSRGQSFLLNIPFVHRNPQSRWVGASTSRTSRSSASAISGESDDMIHEQSASRNIPRSIAEHSVFVPASEMGSLSQRPSASTSRAGSTSEVHLSSPTWSHRSRPQYSRRLSEIVRRSLLSSAGAESEGQTSNQAIQSSSSATQRQLAISSESGSHVPRTSSSRAALLERHLDSAFRIPHSLRSLATAREGRSSIMSEIHRVLDLMQRGEGLRFEEAIVLDHPLFSGMADIHDRHRDMRLDVDNMSYEELLALEERIGNVCTGLTEETITSHLKQWKYTGSRRANEGPAITEPCSICREEYNNGDGVGSLECGHDFHADCIRQWLMHKNLCPICKTTGLTT